MYADKLLPWVYPKVDCRLAFVDNEWVDARGDDPVRVVIAIEADGDARLVQVLWHYHPYRENLLALPLALSRGELRQGPAIDHVTIMDDGEPIIVFTPALVVTFVFTLVILLQH